jgi:uncharacterized membrane protein YgdD (TMEM256/DUF423 family)
MKQWFMLGSVFMFLGVALGAFGAHALSGYFGQFPQLEGTYETAVRYQMFHALGFFVVAWASERFGSTPWPRRAGWLFLVGILLFCSSLYLLVATQLSWLGAVAPFGGAAFLAGWAALFGAALHTS